MPVISGHVIYVKMASMFFQAKDWVASKVTPDCLKSAAEEAKGLKAKMGGGGEGGDPHSDSANKNGITEWEAGWNVTNAIQGMFIVALPYGVLHGGYWAILAMLGVAHICCHTGKILVECLYEVDESGHGEPTKVRFSYKEIAQEVFGQNVGGYIVLGAQLIELLMTCILYVVLCGDLMMGAFHTGIVDTR